MVDLLFKIFIIALVIQSIFLLFIFGKLATYQANAIESSTSPVSVIVCVHNEYKNLCELLPLLLKQDHPVFEIIIVNDRSSDETAGLLKDFAGEHTQVKVINIDEVPYQISPKKFALTRGIHEAIFPVVLLTDADCRPSSKQWITSMTSPVKEAIEVCIGYSPYEKRKGMLNLLIRYETFYTAIQYFSLALSGMPYMGVGRNLSYTKSLFLKNNGFNQHLKILSGDDDLFGNETFRKENVAINFKKESQVFSKPKNTFKGWLKQKSRHLSTGLYYKSKIKSVLALLLFSHLIFYIAGFALAIGGSFTFPLLIAFIFRTLLFIYIFVRISKNFHEQINWYWLPVLDILYILSYILFGINSIFSKHSRWT